MFTSIDTLNSFRELDDLTFAAWITVQAFYLFVCDDLSTFFLINSFSAISE